MEKMPRGTGHPSQEQRVEGVNWLRNQGYDVPEVFVFSSETRDQFSMSEMKRILATGRYVAVATQVVDAGYDFKPAPWLVIDSGLQFIKDEGQAVFPIPSSTRTNADQRWGRTGRESQDRDGVVYTHKQAGTGKEGVNYPEGAMFTEEVISKFFKVPQLKPVEDPDFPDFPVFKVNVPDPAMNASLRFVMLAAFSGVEPREMKRFYNDFAVQGKMLSEDYEWLHRMLATRPSYLQYCHWDLVNALRGNPQLITVNTMNAAGGHVTHWSEWLYPIAGDWRQGGQNHMNIRIGSSTSEAYAYQEMIAQLQREIADYKSDRVEESFLKDLTAKEIQEFKVWKASKASNGHRAKQIFKAKTTRLLATSPYRKVQTTRLNSATTTRA